MSEHEYRIVATKTITATFDVYADDEADARDEVEMAVHGYAADVSDAIKLEQEDWDVIEITEKT